MVSFRAALLAGLALAGSVAHAALTSAEILAFINYHNNVRSRISPTAANMVAVVWNTTSAARAQTWGDSLAASGCSLSHGGTISNEGQNLYAQWSSSTPTNTALANSSITSWESEKASYTYSSCCDGVTGHYTQEVWATTTQIGCAVSVGSGCTVVTCNYQPAGNYVNQKPYVTGTPCASCPSAYPNCTYAYGQGLCYNAADPNSLPGVSTGATPTPSASASPSKVATAASISASPSKVAAAVSGTPSTSFGASVTPTPTPSLSIGASPSPDAAEVEPSTLPAEGSQGGAATLAMSPIAMSLAAVVSFLVFFN